MLQARFLGQYDIRLDGQLVVIPSRPAQSLFAYLLLNSDRSNRRERLAGMFWPDSSDANARSNLRHALWRIRKALGPGADARLESDDLSVSYLPQPGDWLDVDSLERRLDEEVSTDELIQVVSAYGGELLPGFYEEWVVVERERLRASYERTMGMLLDRLLAEQRWNEALEWGERWIATGSIAEPAYRALMLAHAGLGDLAGAAADYQRCVEVLSNELGVEPSERTRKAFEQIRKLGLVELPAPSQAPHTVAPFFWIANPYKGLLAFQEADADNFFGRERLTERLVARLGEAGEATRFLAVVGPSGSGKSSLVKAGLIPALRKGALPGSEKWAIVEMLPGSHPFEELEIGLLRIAAQRTSDLGEQLTRDVRGLLRACRLVQPDDGSEILLVIDQFEEVFTLVEDKLEAQQFMESLCVAVSDPRSLLRVVITLRADFFDHLLLSSDLSRLVQDRTELVIPLTVDEMERAIRSPAEQAGVSMGPGLVAAIVADMVEQPGALPLLQYALTEIFEQRTDNRLTIEAYQAIGGVQGVLDCRAEETYAGLVNRQLSYDLAFLSPDGRWLISRPEEATGATGLTLWDLSGTNLESMDLTTLQPFILRGVHSNNIKTQFFNKDGSLLVTTSLDATAKIWRTSNQGLELLMTLYGHTASVNNAAFSPDGEWLATSGDDGTVRIWDISPKGTSEWFALSGDTDDFRGLAITKDGKYLATASADNAAEVWDLDDEKLVEA